MYKVFTVIIILILSQISFAQTTTQETDPELEAILNMSLEELTEVELNNDIENENEYLREFVISTTPTVRELGTTIAEFDPLRWTTWSTFYYFIKNVNNLE